MRFMSNASRSLGWLLLATLIFVTLAPIGLRPVIGAPVSLERFGAFAVLSFLFAFGYPKHRWTVLVLLILAAASLEALQLIDPTRHGRMGDFLVKAAGAYFGVGAGHTCSTVASMLREHRSARGRRPVPIPTDAPVIDTGERSARHRAR